MIFLWSDLSHQSDISFTRNCIPHMVGSAIKINVYANRLLFSVVAAIPSLINIIGLKDQFAPPIVNIKMIECENAPNKQMQKIIVSIIIRRKCGWHIHQCIPSYVDRD